ncbi:hypothetical protein C8F04DRAFT_1203157 [Mycena alexandri]|uniref:Uncharacterized protein n=1 Tax=Mycena alexandri TaxID=1745969 RepID=A0AAD6RVQ2_9AGAR|nr:hypothetical protein C8F04DRAFT_1203157 [Mycena alexandri]
MLAVDLINGVARLLSFPFTKERGHFLGDTAPVKGEFKFRDSPIDKVESLRVTNRDINFNQSWFFEHTLHGLGTEVWQYFLMRHLCGTKAIIEVRGPKRPPARRICGVDHGTHNEERRGQMETQTQPAAEFELINVCVAVRAVGLAPTKSLRNVPGEPIFFEKNYRFVDPNWNQKFFRFLRPCKKSPQGKKARAADISKMATLDPPRFRQATSNARLLTARMLIDYEQSSSSITLTGNCRAMRADVRTSLIFSPADRSALRRHGCPLTTGVRLADEPFHPQTAADMRLPSWLKGGSIPITDDVDDTFRGYPEFEEQFSTNGGVVVRQSGLRRFDLSFPFNSLVSEKSRVPTAQQDGK